MLLLAVTSVVSCLILYLIIRLAVAHGVADAAETVADPDEPGPARRLLRQLRWKARGL